MLLSGRIALRHSQCNEEIREKEIREAIVQIAERVTIAELCERSRKLNQERFEVVDFVI